MNFFNFKNQYYFLDSYASLYTNYNAQTTYDNYNHQQNNKILHEHEEYDEPPLLEELEIYPEQIIQKSLAFLNPLNIMESSNENLETLLKNPDLIGPVFFCIIFATSLFVMGSQAHFGYIYGLSVSSVIFMYCLTVLMSHANNENNISIPSVASILGYCLLPVVWLSFLGIFVSLNSFIGLILSVGSVILSTIGASKIFCLMTGNPNQRFLIAYPCSLIYIIFAMLVIF